jgi:hypothetical protein
MPLRAYVPEGRAHYYLRGTVKAGKKSRSVYESTGIGAGLPGAAARAEEIRLQREGEIYHELLYGARSVVTFTQAAAEYCEDRNKRRIAENPALAGRSDKQAEYVAKWIRFLRGRNAADIPLVDFCAEAPRLLDAYFDELHRARGNSLATMHREANAYLAVMNFAAHADRKWAPGDFPKPNLPDLDQFAIPVNKWLYAEEIRLFIKLAPKHLRIMVAGIFATGIRGGEYLFVSRRFPNYADRNSTGICLEPGREHVYLGWTKSKKPILRTIPDWYVEMLQAYLDSRSDSHDALILTPKGVPYKLPRRQTGFLVATAWKRLRARVAAVLERLARRKLRLGQKREAARIAARAAIMRQVTPHWGRHNAASHIVMQGFSKSAAQRAAGWASERMVERYLHLAPEHAKDLANTLDFGLGKQAAPRAKSVQPKKDTA